MWIKEDYLRIFYLNVATVVNKYSQLCNAQGNFSRWSIVYYVCTIMNCNYGKWTILNI